MLKRLSLESNRISQIPRGIERLQKLKRLTLYRNELSDSSFPVGFNQLRLKELRLSHNRQVDWVNELDNRWPSLLSIGSTASPSISRKVPLQPHCRNYGCIITD